MKKILVSFVAIMAAASSAMAAETMNMHDQVNNAQAPAHQMQSSAEKSAIQGDSMTMMDMSSFFSHISNFNSEEVEVSDQHCHVTPDNYKNTFFLL